MTGFTGGTTAAVSDRLGGRVLFARLTNREQRARAQGTTTAAQTEPLAALSAEELVQIRAKTDSAGWSIFTAT